MRRPRIAINAAVLTSAIRIDAHLEADVRAVILGDDAARRVRKILRRRPAQRVDVVIVQLQLLELELVVRRLKPVCRIVPRPRPRGAGRSAIAHETLARRKRSDSDLSHHIGRSHRSHIVYKRTICVNQRRKPGGGMGRGQDLAQERENACSAVAAENCNQSGEQRLSSMVCCSCQGPASLRRRARGWADSHQRDASGPPFDSDRDQAQ